MTSWAPTEWGAVLCLTFQIMYDSSKEYLCDRHSYKH